MNKKSIVTIGMLAIAGVFIFSMVDRTQAKEMLITGNPIASGYTIAATSSESESLIARYGTGQGAGTGITGGQVNLPAASPDDLDEVEIAGLLFMREEEKLARDVYVYFYSIYSLPSFQNISLSEQAHMDAIKAPIERYGLTDPASDVSGEFANAELQALYNELISVGSQSLAEALKVGAAIEEIDIRDLEEQLLQTDQADIQQVYGNLLRGSENHLRAFVSTLLRQSGETYQPQYLSQEAFDTIISSANQAGGYSSGATGSKGGYRGGRP
jgi:hypothetical protein